MLLDSLNVGDTYISINYNAIKLFGITNAVYLTELLGIYKKCEDKQKFVDDGFCKLDRRYLRNKLGLTQEEQISCELGLSKVGILKRNPKDKDQIKLNVKLYISILANDDASIIEDIKSKIGTPTTQYHKKPIGVKTTSQQVATKDTVERIKI